MALFSKFSNFFISLKIKKWPKKYQWGQIFKFLSKKEKIALFVFFVLAASSFFYLIESFYYGNTEIKPALGGIHIEGIIGQPRFINPIYANSDADRDLSQLIFSGLMKYDGDLNLIPDLAKEYKIEEQGKVYRFYLRENIRWEDGAVLTAEDVLFTIKTIQGPEFKSPFRANWVGVEVEKEGNLEIIFRLKKPYSSFLENTTVKILPKHIWQNTNPENFALDIHNLKPVGSGPYKLKEIKQDKPGHIESIKLVQNAFYFSNKPNISEIKFLFFDDEQKLANKIGDLSGFSLSLPANIKNNWQNHQALMPRYFAVFFNTSQSKVLSDKNVRIALNYGTDKKELAQKLSLSPTEENLANNIVDSPVLPAFYGLEPPETLYDFDIEKAKEILEKAGFKENQEGAIREKVIAKEPAFRFKSDLKSGSQGSEVEQLQKCLAKFEDVYPEGEVTGNFGDKTEKAVIAFQEKYRSEILDPFGFDEGTGLVAKATREKLNAICFEKPEDVLLLKISLITVDQPQVAEIANLLKDQWRKLGAEVEITTFPIFQLEQEVIKTRNYQSLLFGEVLGGIPDLLPFWHSSQKKDPGLNLAQYDNEKADRLLEEIRVSLNEEERNDKVETLQNLIVEDAPAVFLWNPPYSYFIYKDIKGINLQRIIEPSKRFSNIENWYIKTRRVWK